MNQTQVFKILSIINYLSTKEAWTLNLWFPTKRTLSSSCFICVCTCTRYSKSLKLGLKHAGQAAHNEQSRWWKRIWKQIDRNTSHPWLSVKKKIEIPHTLSWELTSTKNHKRKPNHNICHSNPLNKTELKTNLNLWIDRLLLSSVTLFVVFK